MQAARASAATGAANARGRRTRLALLAAARAILEEHGFGGLTMANVAEHAGVSRRAVYLHFASRSDLVGGLFDYVSATEDLAASARAIRAAPTALAALEAWAHLEATYHVRILGVARAIEHVGRDDPDAVGWRRRIEAYQRELCQVVAQRLVDEHRLADGWTSQTAAEMLWALMATEPLERLLRDRGWTPEQYEQRFANLLRAAFVVPATTT